MSSTVLIASGLKAYLSPLSELVQIENWSGSAYSEIWPKSEVVKGKKVAVIPGISLDTEYFENIDTTNSDFIWLTAESSEAVEKMIASLKPKGRDYQQAVENKAHHRTQNSSMPDPAKYGKW